MRSNNTTIATTLYANGTLHRECLIYTNFNAYEADDLAVIVWEILDRQEDKLRAITKGLDLYIRRVIKNQTLNHYTEYGKINGEKYKTIEFNNDKHDYYDEEVED